MFLVFLSSTQLIWFHRFGRKCIFNLSLLLIVLLFSHSCVLCFIAEKKSSLAVPKRGMSNLCKKPTKKIPTNTHPKTYIYLSTNCEAEVSGFLSGEVEFFLPNHSCPYIAPNVIVTKMIVNKS